MRRRLVRAVRFRSPHPPLSSTTSNPLLESSITARCRTDRHHRALQSEYRTPGQHPRPPQRIVPPPIH